MIEDRGVCLNEDKAMGKDGIKSNTKRAKPNRKTGLRRDIFIKTAVSFMIFFIILMITVTLVLRNNINMHLLNISNTVIENAQISLRNDFSLYQNRIIGEKIANQPTNSFLNQEIEPPRLTDKLNLITFKLSDYDIYASVKITDDKTGNELESSQDFIDIYYQSKDGIYKSYVPLDKYMSYDQKVVFCTDFKTAQSHSKVKINGYIDGFEFYPINVSLNGKSYDYFSNINSQNVNNHELIDSYSAYLNTKSWFDLLKDKNKEKIYSECDKINKKVFSRSSGILSTIDSSSNYIDDDLLMSYAVKFFPLQQAINQLIPVYIIGFFVGLFLMLIVSYKLTIWISSPILALNHTAMRMANGEKNISHVFRTERNDEIGELAGSLEIMSDNLNKALTKVEGDLVKEKQMEQQRRDLTNAIANELKTPLGIIRSFSEGIKENIAEDKKDYYLDVIIDETEQMDKMVLEMLDLSKLEAKAYKLKLESFSLKELTTKKLDRLKNIIDDKKIHIDFICSDEYTIVADFAGFEQIISNFISNAINHTPLGKNIKISIVNLDRKVLFSIENQGKTIPEAQLQKIWDSFYKVDNARERASGGTGLGLAIAKCYLELHKAEYGCHNTPDGVRFWFSIIPDIGDR